MTRRSSAPRCRIRLSRKRRGSLPGNKAFDRSTIFLRVLAIQDSSLHERARWPQLRNDHCKSGNLARGWGKWDFESGVIPLATPLARFLLSTKTNGTKKKEVATNVEAIPG